MIGTFAALSVQRKAERRGHFVDPWRPMASKYGPDVLTPTYRVPLR